MYYVKVNWYDRFREEDRVSHMLICAEGWNEAMLKVNDCFEDINSVDMRHIPECEDELSLYRARLSAILLTRTTGEEIGEETGVSSPLILTF